MSLALGVFCDSNRASPVLLLQRSQALFIINKYTDKRVSHSRSSTAEFRAQSVVVVGVFARRMSSGTGEAGANGSLCFSSGSLPVKSPDTS